MLLARIFYLRNGALPWYPIRGRFGAEERRCLGLTSDIERVPRPWIREVMLYFVSLHTLNICNCVLFVFRVKEAGYMSVMLLEVYERGIGR